MKRSITRDAPANALLNRRKLRVVDVSKKRSPRDRPCPTCGKPNKLTALDRVQGYQCEQCYYPQG